MKDYVVSAAISLSAALGFVAAPGVALATPWLDSAPPNVAELIDDWRQGVWRFQGEQGCEYTFCWPSQLIYNSGADSKYEIPLIPGGPMEARWAEIRAGLKEGKMLFDPDARCLPSGMPQLTRTGGFKMVVEEDRIYLIYGGDQKFRIIWMDGREMPERPEYEYTFNGDSLGHWDEAGNLVIRTENIRGDDKAVGPHLPMSNNFWVEEVWTPVSADEIVTKVTMMDVDNWTKPHTETWKYTRNAEGDIARQTVCIPGEGQRYFDDGSGDYALTGPGGVALEKAED